MGKSCLTNLAAFSDRIIGSVAKEESLMSSIYTSVRPLAQLAITSFSPNWKSMDLMEGPFSA